MTVIFLVWKINVLSISFIWTIRTFWLSKKKDWFSRVFFINFQCNGYDYEEMTKFGRMCFFDSINHLGYFPFVSVCAFLKSYGKPNEIVYFQNGKINIFLFIAEVTNLICPFLCDTLPLLPCVSVNLDSHLIDCVTCISCLLARVTSEKRILFDWF